MWHAIVTAVLACHQYPGPGMVARHLGTFYTWQPWQPTPNAGRIVCTITPAQ